MAKSYQNFGNSHTYSTRDRVTKLMIFTEIEPGTSVEGSPIRTYKNNITDGKYFYLIAGIHGDETEGVFVLQKLFEWLSQSEEVVKVPIIIIPIFNVDGYRDQNRVNSHGVDLNRNLPTLNWSPEFKKDRYNPGSEALSEPESVFLVDLFKEYPPGFVLSFHSWKPVINYRGDAEATAKFISAYNQYPVQNETATTPPGSLAKYLEDTFNVPSISFECPALTDDKSFNDIWTENKVSLEKLFTSEIAGCSL